MATSKKSPDYKKKYSKDLYDKTNDYCIDAAKESIIAAAFVPALFVDPKDERNQKPLPLKSITDKIQEEEKQLEKTMDKTIEKKINELRSEFKKELKSQRRKSVFKMKVDGGSRQKRKTRKTGQKRRTIKTKKN